MLFHLRSLSDIDNDGKLSTEEFVLAMHLVDVAKMNQPLPQRLPPELIPPLYRRSRSGSGSAAVGIPPAPGVGITMPQQAGMIPLGTSPQMLPQSTVPGLDQGRDSRLSNHLTFIWHYEWFLKLTQYHHDKAVNIRIRTWTFCIKI